MSTDAVVRLGFGREGRRRPAETPFRLLVLGDFSGRGEEHPALAARGSLRPEPIDIDGLDALLFRLAPRVRLPAGLGAAADLTISEIDDFHPDRLFARLPLFAELRELRRRLQQPQTFAAAAAELQAGAAASPAADGSVAPPAPIGAGASELERLLGGAPHRVGQPQPIDAVSMTVARLLAQAVGPNVIRTTEAEQRLYVAAVDDNIAQLMRTLLHHPGLQRLEARWRALHWLLAHVETDEDLQIFVLDVGRDELLADVRSVGRDLTKLALYPVLIEKPAATAGGVPWSLIVADMTFGTSGDDVALAGALTALAAEAGAPVLAAAHPAVLGLESLAAVPDPRAWPPLDEKDGRRWQALRRFELAPWFGLCLPRILLRLPYGARGEPIESFAFEELSGNRDHEDYLWGNSAFAAAILVAQAFRDNGWSLSLADHLELDDLPAFTVVEDGEKTMKPCAEAVLSDRAAEAMLARGLMPLLSYPNRPAVRIARFLSIAEPEAALSGPWD